MVSYRIGGDNVKIGSLIIYDNNGKIWVNTGDAGGVINPYTPPEGLPYVITEYGALEGKRVIKVDVETKKLITEDLPIKPTYEELENQLLLGKDGLL